jgi:2-methylcitrate dehydratase PrpD
VDGQELVAALAGLPDVDSVVVRGVAGTSGAVRFDVPDCAAQAAASLRYVLALAMLHGTVSPAALDPASPQGVQALQAIDRVRVDVTSRWDPPSPELTVSRCGSTVVVPLPTLENSDAALDAKWKRVVAELVESGDQAAADRVTAV